MRLILATVLMAAIVTPAAAQYSAMPMVSPSSEALKQQPAMEARAEAIKKPRSGTSAYAQAPAVQRQSLRSANDVYVNGVYVGSDPDPRVRETLRREFISESDSH
jgi:hypothetical protein